MELFHRHDLAVSFATKILHVAPASPSASGIFLSAPRRTGKSTFLREDLRPVLTDRGALVIYVDLWADRKADPGAVLIQAVRSELARHQGVLLRLARSAGMDKVSAGGMSFSLEQVGLGRGVSIVAALAALSQEVRRPIVLVIDEAQHAISSKEGMDALFALKAARDELNSSQHHGLRVVATGSNRDKLAMLRSGRDQAFFGAPLVSFPHLDMDYVQWFCAHAGLPAALDPQAVMPLFERAAYRPEILGAALDELRFDFGLQVRDVASRFAAAVTTQIDETGKEVLRVLHSLTPAQMAVLRVMAIAGERYAPFEKATMADYAQALRAITGLADQVLDVPQVQAALEALKDKELIWKAARGVYAMEETAVIDWLQREAAGQPAV